MSRIRETGVMNGQQVEVVGGWDPPMHTAFLDVMVEGEDFPVRDSMMLHFGKTLSVSHLRSLAQEWGLQVPEAFWQNVASDVPLHLV